MSLTTARDPLDQESKPEREHTNRHFVGFVQGFVSSTTKNSLGTRVPGLFSFCLTTRLTTLCSGPVQAAPRKGGVLRGPVFRPFGPRALNLVWILVRARKGVYNTGVLCVRQEKPNLF